jgi:L-aminopeptidase/D-esterase-like protein
MKTASVGMIWVALLSANTVHAADCVDAKSAKAGFVLEMPGIRSEFRPVAGGMVSVANTYGSQSPQTQFLFGGLVEVFRDSDTGRVAMIPFSDLRKLFPLKTGAKSTIEFVELSPNKQPKSTKTLSLVVKGKETFSVGGCKYNVLAVKETFKNGAGETLDTFTALYAPDLQASLARRYDEGTSSESVNGYETIKPLSN